MAVHAFQAFRHSSGAFRRWHLVAAASCACSVLASGCAVDGDGQAAEGQSPGASAYGELHLALTGALPGAAAFRLRVYQGAVTNPSQAPLQDFGCKPYGGTESNKLIIQDLEARSDYAVLLDLFEDGACTKPRYRAYRGAIAVTAGSGATVKENPYWLPTVEFGQLSQMAQVKPALNDTAASKTCSIDADCQGIHVNATCGASNRCKVDNLYPLNGWSRRGLPSSVALEDGRVAIVGGLSVLTNSMWAASAEQVEVFDPRTAMMTSRLVKNAGSPVAMAEAVTLSGGAFAMVGGTSRAKVLLSPGKLTAQLDTEFCAAAGSGNCAVTESVARWTVAVSGESSAQQFALGLPVAFPAAARVMTPNGERLLVAGGTEVPISAGFDKRRGKAMLCKADASQIVCDEETSKAMNAGRANAAVACIAHDAGGNCTKVALFGGRKSPTSPLTEIYDAATNAFVVASDIGAPPQDLHGGRLFPVGAGKFLLVGATAKKLFLEDTELAVSGAQPIYLLSVDASAAAPVITWKPLDLGAGAGPDGGKRLLAAAVQLADGSVLISGGLDASLAPIANALWLSPDGSLRSKITANIARFGATASRIHGKGPLAGCAVLAGGFALGTDSVLAPQNQIELFCPNP